MHHQIEVIKGGTGLCGTHAFAISLECRLAGLLAVYQGQCGIPLTEHALKTQLSDYIARGGHIHVALSPEGRILGWASILIHPSNQLLENVYLVERLVVDHELVIEEQRVVAHDLIASLVADADATLPERFDDAWVMITIPAAVSLDSMQALFTELAAAGFVGAERVGLATFTLWRERSMISAAVQTAA